MLSRRSLAALALTPVMPAAVAVAAVPDPIFEAIARSDAAQRQWEAEDESSLDLTIADLEQDAVLATTPTTVAGILALIAWARREHFLEAEPDGTVVETIERALAGVIERHRP